MVAKNRKTNEEKITAETATKNSASPDALATRAEQKTLFDSTEVETKKSNAKTNTTTDDTAQKGNVARKSTREARIEGSKNGRKVKSTYLQYKVFALDREKKNYSKLFIIHERGEWWKMVGHSAIFFYHEISRWIDMKCKLLPDTDYEAVSQEGVVNIRDIGMLDKKLAAHNINAISITDDYRVYNIGRKFTDADIAAMKDRKVKEWSRINKIILPKEIFPTLESGLRELVKKIYFSTRQFDAMLRVVTGDVMLKTVSDLLTEYSMLVNNEKGLTASGFLKRVEKGMGVVVGRMLIITEFRLLTDRKTWQILQSVSKIRRELEQCRPKKM